MSWSGMGSLALLLWYTLHAEGEGGVPCLRKDPRAPSHPQPFGTNVPEPRGDSPCSVQLLLSSAQQEIHFLPILWPRAGIQCSGLPLGEGVAAQPFHRGSRGSSPSFSHCELSIEVYTTLTYLFIAPGKGQIAGSSMDS